MERRKTSKMSGLRSGVWEKTKVQTGIAIRATPMGNMKYWRTSQVSQGQELLLALQGFNQDQR